MSRLQRFQVLAARDEYVRFLLFHECAVSDDLTPEIVLSTLVAAFKFELSDKPFVWNTAGVTYPAAKRGDKRPEMILKLSLVSE